MSYENAPATKMLATECAVCGRPLVDSVSVETGMGPECRRRHGYNQAGIEDEARAEGNALVYRVACGVDRAELVTIINRLRTLGFSTLAGVLADRNASVHVVEADGALAVKAPYSEAATATWRTVPGRRWDGNHKVNVVPNRPDARAALWALLRRHYAGALMRSSRGLVTIPA